MIPLRCFQNQRRSRGGYVYVAVLMTSLVLAALTAASMHATIRSRQAVVSENDHELALELARSELHRQLVRSGEVAGWSSELTNDVFSSWRTGLSWAAGGRGSVRHRLTDVDGSPGDDPADSLELTVHARVDQADAAVQMILNPVLANHESCHFAITASGDFKLKKDGRLSSEMPIQVGGDVDADEPSTLVAPQLRTDGTLDPTSLLRGELDTSPAIVPNVDMIAMYRDDAVEIDFESLPKSGKEQALVEIVLTSSSNPFGVASDIYLIQGSGNGNDKLVIEDCRIEATLIIANISEIKIEKGIIWSPPPMASVSLATDAKIKIDKWEEVLDENDLNVNFNPTNAPYEGVADNDQIDVYATQLNGVFWTTDKFDINSPDSGDSLRIRGMIVCEDFDADSPVHVHRMDDVRLFPPRGLQQVEHYVVQPGSYERVFSPL